jgi:hypothetical protein
MTRPDRWGPGVSEGRKKSVPVWVSPNGPRANFYSGPKEMPRGPFLFFSLFFLFLFCFLDYFITFCILDPN